MIFNYIMQSIDNKIFDKVERCEEMFEKIIKLYLEAKEIEKSRWEQGDFFNIFNRYLLKNLNNYNFKLKSTVLLKNFTFSLKFYKK